MASAVIALQMPMASPVATSQATSAFFINEIHYDNTVADADEAIEIVGPVGTDLSGWSLVFYNATAAPCTTPTLCRASSLIKEEATRPLSFLPLALTPD